MAGTTQTAPPLRRNWRFQTLWFGSAIGYLGIEAADIGYPLLILTLTGSPAVAGGFGLVQAASNVLLALPAGRATDRYDRRRVLLGAEALRMLAAGSVALAVAAGHVALPHLIAVAALLGAGSAFGGPARLLVVRAVVPPEQLTGALTQEEVRGGLAQLLGPPLGGLLFAVRHLAPFLFSAGAFAVSWVCALIVRIPPRRVEPGEDGSAASAGGWFDGIRALMASPVLRTATFLVTALNTVGAPLALIAVVILRQQSVSSTAIGLAMSGLALGALAGAALITPIYRWLRPGVLLLVVVLTEVPIVAGLGLQLGPWWMGALLFCAMLGIPALRVLIDVLIFRQVPDERRGRAVAAVVALIGLGMPVGSGAAGLLLQYLSAGTAMLVLAGVLAAAGLYALTQRELVRARWPAED